MKWLQNNLVKLKNALLKTRTVLELDQSEDKEKYLEVDNEFFVKQYEKFIRADIGTHFSKELISLLKKELKEEKIKQTDFFAKTKGLIKSRINLSNKILSPLPDKLNIYLMAGVNGSGKTTTIGKLAKRFKDDGFKVLIVAADTFRAAASDQLTIWGNKAGVEIYSPKEIKKPDAVVFSAIEKAKKENYNLLLIDTAGRLHSQINLMDELKKICSVINKHPVGINRELSLQVEKLIVLDATIGQNAITQAEFFSKVIGLTGIVLAKLDSSSKGGVTLNIMNKFSLPVKYVGTGEKIDDIADFNLDEYLDGLL